MIDIQGKKDNIHGTYILMSNKGKYYNNAKEKLSAKEDWKKAHTTKGHAVMYEW